MSLIYWDTMLFVYWIEEHPIYAERVRRIYERMEERKDTLCTDSIAVGETLTGPYKSGERETALRVREFFRPPFVKVIPFTDTAADQYARIRAELGVSPADAVHLACAAESECRCVPQPRSRDVTPNRSRHSVHCRARLQLVLETVWDR